MIRENQTLLNRINILLDGVIAFIAFLLGYWLRFFVMHGARDSVPFRSYVIAALLLIPLHLFTYAILGLYESQRKRRLYQELGRLFWANALDAVVLMMGLFLVKGVHFSRLALIAYLVIEYGALSCKRIFLRKYLNRLRIRGKNQKHIVLIGSGETARHCLEEIRRSAEFGYHVLGYISDRSDWEDLPWLSPFSQMDEILDRLKPDEVIAGLDLHEFEQMPAVINACETSGTRLSMIPFYAQYMPAHPQIDSLNGLPLINLRRIPLDNIGNAFLKRSVDVVGSLVLLLLSSPLMLMAAVGVKLSSPGPIIFKQERVGLNKKNFYMYKFRSMRVNADSATAWSRDVDPRKTRFGSFIRKFSIDELPQFVNVLKGDMSLVGPRPELPHFVAQFKQEIPLYMVKHQVRPGITGWAQVNGLRGDTSISERIRYDIFYIENWSLMLDIKILLMTVFKAKNSEKLAGKSNSPAKSAGTAEDCVPAGEQFHQKD